MSNLFVYDGHASEESDEVSFLNEVDDERIKAGWDSLAETWAPLAVSVQTSRRRGKLSSQYSVLSLAAGDIVLRKHARDALQDILSKEGEFLPLQGAAEVFWLFRPTNPIPALDLQKSGVHRFADSGRVAHIYSYAFLPEVLDGHAVFVIPESPILFYTQVFVDRFRNANVTLKLSGRRSPRWMRTRLRTKS